MSAAALGLVLSVVVPLAAAFAAVVVSRPRLLVGLAAPAVLAAAALVATAVWRAGPLRLAIGGWEAPLGIALVADGLSAGFLAVTAPVMAAVLVAALPEFGNRTGETRPGWAFWPLGFMMWAALNAVFLSGDLFNIYVSVEFLTLATLSLVALEGKAGPIEAAMRYALFALFGSLAYLLGAALIYAEHGTLDVALLAGADMREGPGLVAAALITTGLAAKTALFPSHAWLPPAHAGAPAPASAMLSALVPKASFYVLVRFWFDVMPGAASAAAIQLLGALGAAAIVYGSLLAIRQDGLKRLVAYSTVAQLGYLFLVFPLAGGEGPRQPWVAGAWAGAMFHALSHALAKAAMFLAAGLAIHAAGHGRVAALNGVARTMPMTAFAMGLAAVTIMGLPPSGGFVAKYLLLTAALASQQVVWALVIVLGGVLAAGYLLWPLSRAFLRPGAEPAAVARRVQAIPLALAGASILLGVASAPLYELLQVGRPAAAEEGLE